MSDQSEPGSLSVLNVGHGDLKLSFNSQDPAEVERARKAVNDMLNRGYAIFVELAGGKLRRVKKFDSRRDVYIVADVPAEAAAAGPAQTGNGRRSSKQRTASIPAKKAKATAVAPTAGG